jgi:hypothetical protein
VFMGPGLRRGDNKREHHFRISKYPLDYSANQNYLPTQPVPP